MRRARSTRRRDGVPVRPRRRADPDREGPRGRVEADVRRLPAPARGAARRAVRPVRRGRATTTSTSTASRATTASARSSPRAGSSCRRARRATTPGAETIDGLGNRKNEIVLTMIREQGVEPYEGSVRYVEAARDAGLRRAVVSSSTNCRDVLVAAGIVDLFEEIVDGVVAEREHLRGKPAPDTFLAGARALGVDARAGGRVRGRAGRRRRPAARATSASSSASIASARPRRCSATAPTSWCRTWPSCSTRRDQAPGLSGRAVGGARDRPAARPARADRSRCSRSPTATSGCAATSTRASRTGLPGTYLERLLRAAAAALRRGRLRLPRGGSDGRQRDQRQDHPPARRRRAVRRPLRRAAQPRARARPARRRAAPDGRVGLADGHGACACHSTRLVSFTQRAVAAILYEVEPLDAAVRGRRPVRARRQRAAAAPARRSARGGGAGRAAARRRCSTTMASSGRSSCTSRRRPAGCVMAAAMDHVVDGPRRDGDRDREPPRTRRVTVIADVAPGQRAAARQVPRLRVVGQRSMPALRDQVGAALARRATRGWDGLLAAAARVPRRLLGRAPTSRSRATPSSSRRSASRCSTCSRRARAPSSARSPPRA